jgi:hypothetical protein
MDKTCKSHATITKYTVKNQCGYVIWFWTICRTDKLVQRGSLRRVLSNLGTFFRWQISPRLKLTQP